MNRRKFIGATFTGLPAVGVSCSIHFIPRQREIILVASASYGATVEGFAEVDRKRHELPGVKTADMDVDRVEARLQTESDGGEIGRANQPNDFRER